MVKEFIISNFIKNFFFCFLDDTVALKAFYPISQVSKK